MDYEKTVPFNGNIKKALEVARNVFVPHGLQIVSTGESTLELLGTGTLWTKGRDPLVGISRANIRGGTGNLSIEAEFGVIRKTIKYLVLFILGMATFFLIIFGIMFSRQGLPFSKIILISLAPFIPWPIIFPLIAKFFRYRTSQALDVLLNNMVAVGTEG